MAIWIRFFHPIAATFCSFNVPKQQYFSYLIMTGLLAFFTNDEERSSHIHGNDYAECFPSTGESVTSTARLFEKAL